MGFGRLLKHVLFGPIPLRRSFTKITLERITKAIEEAETKTSAEFEVVIERSLPYSYLRDRLSTRDRAEELFSQYRCWDTEDNNGVLIYLNLSDQAIEIIVDRAASRVLTPELLAEIIKKMSQSFKTNNFATGIKHAVLQMGEILGKEFPNKPVSKPLPNEPILLEH
ncbi:MAG: TPM domain-containing protein [Burkholderiales bacterium]|nr:TPM domain-containing protein [Burkholderiales bacterium]